MRKKLLLCAALVLSSMGLYAQQAGDIVFTATGKYKIVGENLIADGNFANGTTGWTDDNGSALSTDSFEVRTDEGELTYLFASQSATFQRSWDILSVGNTYVAGFSVKSETTASQRMTTTNIFTSTDGAYVTSDAGFKLINNISEYGSADWTTTQNVFTAEASFLGFYFSKVYSNTDYRNFYCFAVAEVANTEALQNVIDQAKALYNDEAYVNGKQDLADAIETAEGMLTSEDVNDVNDAIFNLKEAIRLYTEANSVDCTNKVADPNFDNAVKNSTAFPGWTNAGFKGNNSATYSSNSGNTVNKFAEQWAASSATSIKYLPSTGGDINQTIDNLPAGVYRLSADAMACNQGDDAIVVEGVELYINDEAVAVATGNGAFQGYSVQTTISEGGSIKLGYRFSTTTTANWCAVDNVKLTFIGDVDAFNEAINGQELIAARKELTALIDSAKVLVADETYKLGLLILQDTIDAYKDVVTSKVLEDVQAAVGSLTEAIKRFYINNEAYLNLVAEIKVAQALLDDESYANGHDELTQAIAQANAAAAEAAAQDTKVQDDLVPVHQKLIEDLAALKAAETMYGVANASYAHPVNIISNGGMESMDGWDCLLGGTANPALHINTSGNVTGFNKPFMECWVASPGTYGQENYAKQSVYSLPDGTALPSGYYILKANVVAVQQGSADVPVTGVTLYMDEEAKEVSSGNGVSTLVTIGHTYESPASIEIGLHIDAATTANWIGWDNVELQYVGSKEQYDKDYVEAQLKEVIDALQAEIDKAKALLDEVDTSTGNKDAIEDFNNAISDGEDIIENPTDYEKDEIIEATEFLIQAQAELVRSGVSPKAGKYFDFTNLIVNNDFEDGVNGWNALYPYVEGTETEANPLFAAADGVASAWFGSPSTQLVQGLVQTVEDMPAGNYIMKVNAAIRLGGNYSTAAYTDSTRANYATEYAIFANDNALDIHPFFYEDEAKGLTLDGMMAMTNDWDYRHGNGTLIDNMLLGNDGLFNSYLAFTLEDKEGINIGFRVNVVDKNGTMPFLDKFELFYYGQQDITGIANAAVKENSNVVKDNTVYSISGQTVRTHASSLAGLPKGLYIFNGRKVVVK